MTDVNPGLWLCGNSQVQLFPADPDAGGALWSWDSATAADLPADRRDWLYSLDEVKPVTLDDGEPCLLLTASWRGAVALLRRRDRAVIFLLPLPNAHSAELLPGGWLACAGSAGSDCLLIHHLSAGLHAEGARLRLPLPHGHGAVFEPARSRLWVCGAQVVRAYRWRASGDACACDLEREIALPTGNAHDLMVDASGCGLVVTTEAKVWQLDPATGAVTPFAPLHALDNVKSVSFAPDGTLAYTKAPGHGQWWTEEAVLVRPDGSTRRRRISGRRLYKVRWDRPCRLG